MQDKVEEIQEALEILGLPGLVTREDVKKRYRRLVRRWHPDRPEGDREEMERIHRAYEMLRDYMDHFKFRFDREEILQQYPESGHQDQFRI
ncbi:J domain-containing protein [Nitratifractor sp.]